MTAAWIDGDIVPLERAGIPVGSAAARYGLNAFEGICGYRHASADALLIFRLRDHAQRLVDSSRLLGLETDYGLPDFEDAVIACVRANDLRVDCQIRLTLFVVGEGNVATCGPVSLICTVAPRAERGLAERSLSAGISSWRRIDDTVMPPRAKVGANYLNGRYGLLDARAANYDEAIFLTREGKVAEATSACLFMARRGRLVTPASTDSILESVTRDSLLHLAVALGLDVEERAIDRSELMLADEIFLCGSAYEISPVTALDGRPVGNGGAGPITTALWGLYERVVRGHAPGAYAEDWLRSIDAINS